MNATNPRANAPTRRGDAPLAPVRLIAVLFLIALAIPAAGCAAVAGIFKAGVWVGVIIAVIVIAGVVLLFSRLG